MCNMLSCFTHCAVSLFHIEHLKISWLTAFCAPFLFHIGFVGFHLYLASPSFFNTSRFLTPTAAAAVAAPK